MPSEIISPAALLRRVRTRTFDYAAKLREVAEARLGPVSCRPGCSWCCNAKVMIDASEGAMIALHLAAEGRLAGMRKKLAEVDREMTRTSHHRWYGRPCVFLKSEGPGRGRCTVYPVRPVGCLATFSVRPPEDCRESTNTSQFQVYDEHLRTNLLLDHEALLVAAGETKTMLMTLPGAVLYGAALLADEPRPDVFRVAREDYPGEEGPPSSAKGLSLVAWLDREAGAV